MGRYDEAGNLIRGLLGNANDLERLQGVTGIPTPWLERVLKATGLNPATATPDDVYRAYSKMRTGEELALPGKPVEYVPPDAPSEAGPVRESVEQRAASPNSRFLDTIGEWDPALAQRLRGASADEILAAYRAGPPESAALVPAERSGRGIPVGLSGPGRMVPGPTGLIPAPLRGISGETRALSVPGSRALSVPPDQRAAEAIAGQFDRVALRRGPFADDGVGDDFTGPIVPRLRSQEPPRIRGRDAAGAGAVAAGVGAALMFPPNDTANLVNESRPAPKVAATKETPKPTVKQGPPDYAAQARALIARANDIQMATGRITPESAALTQEANRLYQLAAEGRRAGTQPGIMPVQQQNAQTSAIQRNARQQMQANTGGDPRSQARRLMAELNMRSSQGGVSPQDRQRIVAEINRLFAMADAQDNARRAG